MSIITRNKSLPSILLLCIRSRNTQRNSTWRGVWRPHLLLPQLKYLECSTEACRSCFVTWTLGMVVIPSPWGRGVYLKIQIFPHGTTQHDTGQEARAPPAGVVALMQLCCVSDWPLHALSWQQSKGGSPGLPAPLNQKALAAPLSCTSEFDSALASHLHPAKTSLWPFLPSGYPRQKTDCSILFFATSVSSNQMRQPPFPIFSPFASGLILEKNAYCLLYPLLYFAPLTYLSPPNKHLCHPTLPKLSLPPLTSFRRVLELVCEAAEQSLQSNPPHLNSRNQNTDTAGAL